MVRGLTFVQIYKKVKGKQGPGTDAIRTKITPSNQSGKQLNFTTSQNTK